MVSPMRSKIYDILDIYDMYICIYENGEILELTDYKLWD